MFYKYNSENNEWYTGLEIHCPGGVILSVENQIPHDGWQWHDEPPQEYLEWIENQNKL
jgi:hypothetical protein